jgi:uncharacterized membrane protein YgdD (TMEM256/DUF423 family)
MTQSEKAFVIIGALSLTLAAMLGAYGVHGLADSISPQRQQSWGWAVQMQSYHSLGLLLIAALDHRLGHPALLKWAGWIFVAGMLLFSGSIYLDVLGMSETIGEIAPIGGTSFMVGWVLVALAAYRAGPAAS